MIMLLHSQFHQIQLLDGALNENSISFQAYHYHCLTQGTVSEGQTAQEPTTMTATLFVYSSALTHQRPNILVLAAYDTNNRFCIIEISEIPFHVQIKLSDFQKDKCLQSYISKSKWYTNIWESTARHISPVDIITISSCDLTSIKSLEYFIQSRGISLLTHHNYQDAFSSGYMASYIGLDGLCRWYDIECEEVDGVPTDWPQSYKDRCQRYFRMKYSSLAITKDEIRSNDVQMKTLCMLINSEPCGTFQRAKRLQEEGETITNAIYSVSLKHHDEVKCLTTRKSGTTEDVYGNERDLLLGLSKYIILGNFAIMCVLDVEGQFDLLRARFHIHNLDNMFDRILTKHPYCYPKYLTTNAKQYSGLGVCVIDVKRQMNKLIFPEDGGRSTLSEMEEKSNECIASFCENVRNSGVNFRYYSQNEHGVKPSEIYNIQITKYLRGSDMVLPLEKERGDKPTVQGGLVFQPLPCFTFDPVVSLDFKSMYASIIRTFNLCLTTMTDKRDENVYESPLRGTYFYLPNEIRGILPRILSSFQTKRDNIKKSTSDHKHLSIRDKSLKNIMVSIIGQNMSGSLPFTSPTLANVITAFGRELLVRLREASAEFNHESLSSSPSVIYGDTDSLMVLLKLVPHEGDKREEILNGIVADLVGYLDTETGKYIASYMGHDESNVMSLKVEGVSLCALQYIQKKRYVYLNKYANRVDYIKRGVISIQSNVFPLLSELEVEVHDILLKGWYLCKNVSRLAVLPPNQLSVNMEVYTPDIGWKKVLGKSETNEGDTCRVVLSFEKDASWTRSFVDDDINIDGLLDEEIGEKTLRYNIVNEYIRLQMKYLKQGSFPMSKFVQYKKFKQNGDDVARDIVQMRNMFGLQEATAGSDIAYVKIDRGQETRFDWQRLLTKQGHQDPILVAREKLRLDIDAYTKAIEEHFLSGEKSLYKVLDIQDKFHEEDEFQEVIEREIVQRPLNEFDNNSQIPPDYRYYITIVTCAINVKKRYRIPRNKCLIGNQIEKDKVHNWYCDPRVLYDKDVIDFVQKLNK